jgi:hypothetical protein
VGTARRFFDHYRESLVADLRTILAPQNVERAREIATPMTEPAKSVAAAADLPEISFASSVLADRRRRAVGVIGADGRALSHQLA